MRKLNVRLVLILFAITVLVSGGVHFAHELQVGRTARFLLTLADRDEADNKPGDAANSLARYVHLVPEDTDALARLGRAQVKLGHFMGAFATLEQVLRREPEREEERRDIVTAAMRIGRFTDAREHLQQHILKNHPDDAVSLDLLGQCQAGLGEYREAAATFEDVLAARPESVETYARLAELLRGRLERPADADAIMDRLVEHNGSSHQAWLLRARYRTQVRALGKANAEDAGRLIALAADDARKAVELAPDDLESLLLAAYLVRRKAPLSPEQKAANQANGEDQPVARAEATGGEVAANAGASADDEARGYLETGLKAHPDQPALYRALADLEYECGRRDAALEVARRGLQELDGDPGLLWTLAELLILDKQFDEADKTIAQLQKNNAAGAPADYLAARLLIARGKLAEASNLLARLQPKLIDWPELAKQADVWSGRCYDQLERVDDQLSAFRRAVEADGNWAPARLGLAGALLKIGRFDEAVEECRLAASADGFPAEGLISLARMMIVQRLRVPAAQRDWRQVEQVLELAATQLPDSLDVPELRAEMLLAQDKTDEARACLAESGERHPDEVRVWLSRAALEQRLGEWKAAEALLAKAEEQVGDSIDMRIGRIRFLVQRPGEGAAPAIAALAEGLDEFDKPGQARLCTVLAFTLRAVGEKDKAVELAKRANGLDPDNLPARLFLFDYAMETQDAASMEELIAEIRRIEGPEGGPLSRYGDALRLVIGAKADDTESLEWARRQLTEARLQRPAWARLPLLEAQIEELRGNTAGAIDFYRQAVDLGLRQPATVQRLVALLFAQRRFAEADQALRKLDDQQTPFTTELGRLASKVSLQVEDFTRAIDMARKTCVTSTNSADHVWLGQLAGALARGARTEAAEREKLNEEADTALRRAVELAPTEPEVWVALVQHLVRTEQTADADEALTKAVEKIAENDRPLVLAECYLSMGRRDEAAEQFGLALKARPDDVLTLRRASEFHLSRGAFAEGEPLLRRLMEPELKASDADVAFARRGLALVLAADKSYQKLQVAIALLDENLEKNPLSIEDRKDKALLLARSPALADRQLARSTLVDVLRQAMTDNSSRLLLAQLYAASGDVAQARRQFQTLLAEAGDNPAYIASYIRILLTGTEIGEAELWLAKLEELQPASLETKELRARLLVANGDAQAAIDMLKALRSDDSDDANAKKNPPPGPERIALLMEGLASSVARRDAASATSPSGGNVAGPRSTPETKSSEQRNLLLAAAEELLREAAGEGSRGRAALAAFLGRHGRPADALKLWLEFFEGEDYETAASGCSLLAATQQLNAEQLAEVERRLVKAKDAHPESLGVLSALALIYDAQVRYDQAVATYRGILAKDRDNVVALNNLALNLALRNQPGSDALKLIDRALAARGPAATLLDTRGTVYLAMGKADKAIADLEEAVAQEPAASYYFHLARAHLLRGDRQAAAAAVERAKQTGLREESLHLLERGDYRKVLDSVSS